MNNIAIASELLKLAKSLTATSASVGSWQIVSRDVKTKAGVEFKIYEELKLVEYVQSGGGYKIRLEGRDGKALSVSVGIAHKIFKSFPKPPSISTMNKWINDGVAKAIDGTRIEPDGVTHDGVPSWILAMGLI